MLGSVEHVLDDSEPSARCVDAEPVALPEPVAVATPLDAAQRSGAAKLVEWLRARGAKSASQLD